MPDQVHQGDMREVLAEFPDGYFDCAVTSPPYWSQRQYAGETECLWADGWYGELGREPTVELYIAHILECFRELWRVLSPYGTLWLNLGGCYWGGKGRSGQQTQEYQTARVKAGKSFNRIQIGGPGMIRPTDGKHPVYKPLDYVPVPHLVAKALQREGWYLRRPIVWHKKGPMPESPNTWRWERCRVKVADGPMTSTQWQQRTYGAGKHREPIWEPCPGCPKCEPHGGYRLYYGAWRPTNAHEYVFLMSKTGRYFCDQEAVRTPHADATLERAKHPHADRTGKAMGLLKGEPQDKMVEFNPAGANARSVQSWPTASLPTIAGRDHFAAFSVELAAWCIRAGTSPRGYCPKCSRPWVRVVEREKTTSPGRPPVNTPQQGPKQQHAPPEAHYYPVRYEVATTTLGWKATCECGEEPRPGIVCDPFGGAGTVGLAAKGLGRSYILCEISEEYVAMAEARIRKGFTPNKKRVEQPEEQMRLW